MTIYKHAMVSAASFCNRTFLSRAGRRENQMRVAKSVALMSVLCFCSWFCWNASGQSKSDISAIQARLAHEVRHTLTMLSNYTVFDNLEFEISGIDTVTLLGQVARPSLKSDAESAVRGIEGVGKLVNKIEVLPISPDDERIRVALYRAIYSKPGLDTYSLRAVPPIHIIVKNGKVTLVGIVAKQIDKDLAGIAAKEVRGTFEVINNLRVEYK
jgi:hyperosmotically inducible periplasmic protein